MHQDAEEPPPPARRPPRGLFVLIGCAVLVGSLVAWHIEPVVSSLEPMVYYGVSTPCGDLPASPRCLEQVELLHRTLPGVALAVRDSAGVAQVAALVVIGVATTLTMRQRPPLGRWAVLTAAVATTGIFLLVSRHYLVQLEQAAAPMREAMREGLRHDGLGGQWASSRLGWWPGMTDALVIGLLLSLPAVLFYMMAAIVAGRGRHADD